MKQTLNPSSQPRDRANIDIGQFKKKIKKDEKEKRYLERKDQHPIVAEEEQEVLVAVPKANIFAVDNYESGIKTVVNIKEPQLTMQD